MAVKRKREDESATTTIDKDSDEIISDLQKNISPKTSKKKSKKKKNAKKLSKEEEDANRLQKIAEASEYLNQWAKRDDSDVNWKFKKLTQIWLLKHCFDSDMVEKSDFKIFVKYVKDLKGQARSILQKQATEILEKWEKQEPETEQQKDDDEDKEGDEIKDTNSSETKKDGLISKTEFKRAKKILKKLNKSD
ncbi:hypothetical protein HK098_000123 [Nowakowskiella sp. JEL0407]|nr:hypothetical protein HK098_000123 [Nowakowskiella sp. JEL0407]